MARGAKKTTRGGKSPPRKSSPPSRTKPREQLSEPYRKRIERGERLGKSRQAARGKKAAEHKERARREVEKYGARKPTIDRLAAEARHRASRGRTKEEMDAFERDFRAWAKKAGQEGIDKRADILRNLNRTRKRFRVKRRKDGSYRLSGKSPKASEQRARWQSMEQAATDLGLPDVRMLYYH